MAMVEPPLCYTWHVSVSSAPLWCSLEGGTHRHGVPRAHAHVGVHGATEAGWRPMVRPVVWGHAAVSHSMRQHTLQQKHG